MEWLQRIYGVRDGLLNNGAVNAKKILSEQRDFKDSEESLGLQLADMLANILRRALNGHLAPLVGVILVRFSFAKSTVACCGLEKLRMARRVFQSVPCRLAALLMTERN
jgi:hypothetical protein